MNQPMLFRNFDSRPNTLKVFDDYRSCVGFQGFSGNLIGDIPQQPINATPAVSRAVFGLGRERLVQNADDLITV